MPCVPSALTGRYENCNLRRHTKLQLVRGQMHTDTDTDTATDTDTHHPCHFLALYTYLQPEYWGKS